MDRKEVGIITGGGNAFVWDKEGIRAIQETFSLNPDMLRNEQDAPEAPKEVKEAYIELLEAEILSVEGAEINFTPSYDETTSPTLSESIDAAFHAEGHHLTLTATFLNKEGLE